MCAKNVGYASWAYNVSHRVCQNVGYASWAHNDTGYQPSIIVTLVYSNVAAAAAESSNQHCAAVLAFCRCDGINSASALVTLRRCLEAGLYGDAWPRAKPVIWTVIPGTSPLAHAM